MEVLHLMCRMLNPTFAVYLKLTVHDGCLLWGNRVIVPPHGRPQILAQRHPGASRMKNYNWLAVLFGAWNGSTGGGNRQTM